MRLRAAAERVQQQKIVFDYQPQARQLVLHSTAVRQILYGGAAMGGKSYALLMGEGIARCLSNPGLQAYLFRRTLPELEANHLRIIRGLPKEFGTYHETRRQFLFYNGAILHAGYAEQESDIRNYQGREMHMVLIDEAAQWTPLQLGFLKGWNRIGSWKPAPGYEHVFPRFICTSNPGGPGHTYLKRIFMPPGILPETVFYDAEMKDPTDPSDKGWTTIFIPSRMTDNAYADKNYAGSFGGLPPEMRKALIDGDWDVVAGAAFENLNARKDDPLSHVCRPFKPPRHWTHFMAIDWGTARPFSVGWYCVSEGAELAAKDGWPAKWLPSGAVIRYREWYGWSGKENEGCRYDAGRVARRILEIEHDNDDPPMDFRVGDSAMWAQHDGPSVAEHFMEEEVVLNQSAKDRKAGYAEMRSRLAGNPSFLQDGTPGEFPMLYISSQCQHFWRTIPSLTLDETEPDKGPDTKLEDHCFSAGTMVAVNGGAKRIEDVKSGDLVLTSSGWLPCIALGVTRAEAEVWQIEFDDGFSCRATPDHKFYLNDGTLARLDELVYTSRLWRQSFSTAGSSTSAGDTGATPAEYLRASAFSIARSGLRNAGRFLRNITSTIRTATQTTTTPPISNYSPLRPILASTVTIPIVCVTPSGTWKLECGPAPSNGINRLRGWLGIPSRGNGTAHWEPVSQKSASDAGMSFLLSSADLDSVPEPAWLAHSEIGIRAITPMTVRRPVYCLNVPGPHNFCLANGVLIRNCYDEVVYALRRRPYVTTEHDRWREEVRLSGYRKVQDPYATA